MHAGTVALLLLVVVLTGHNTEALLEDDFPSKYLQINNLLNLMKKEFELSLKQLLTSKQYGGQDVEFPGMAKFLAEESDRHWEDGMNILKKYLEIGGAVGDNFKRDFRFSGKGELHQRDNEQMNMMYLETLKTLATTSRDLNTQMTKAYRKAHQEDSLDGEVARFMLELCEKETETAHKMASGANIFNNIKNDGVARKLFDQNL